MTGPERGANLGRSDAAHVGRAAAFARFRRARAVEVALTVARRLLGGLLTAGRARLRHPGRRPETPVGPLLVRETLEELGPTFTKLGQMIAGRPDLVPAPYLAELGALRDHARPLPPAVAQAAIEAAFAQPTEQLFASLSPDPFAAASIGQVHRATLRDGRAVAVKVRRPDAGRLVDADLAVLAGAARLLDRAGRRMRLLQFPALVAEFGEMLHGELDYLREAENAVSIGAHLARLPWLVVPGVVRELCGPDVLVMDYVEGISLTRTDELTAGGFDRPLLGTEVFAVNLHLVLAFDLFHADPHAGNYLVTSDGRLAMLDFGQVGRSSATVRSGVLRLVSALLASDVESASAAISELCEVPRGREGALGAAVTSLVAGLDASALGQVRIGPLLRDLFVVLGRHSVAVPPVLSLMAKAILESESTAQELDASLNVGELIGSALGIGALLAAGARDGGGGGSMPGARDRSSPGEGAT